MTQNLPEVLFDCQGITVPDCVPAAGALSGLRLGVKDLFHIAGLPTSAGNPDWLATHPIPKATSPVVKALIEAGAQLRAKTLTDEIAYSLNGVNVHYGTPANALDARRVPGGSSSGSAITTANSAVDIGLGTDTGGSVRVPASYNGLYGIRPSHGVISVEHLVGLSPRFDTVGWLTRDFDTLARVADVLLPKQSTISTLSNCVVLLPENLTAWLELVPALTTELKAANVFERIDVKPLPTEITAKASAAFRVLQGFEIWREHGEWIETYQPEFAADITERLLWCQTITIEQKEAAEQQALAFLEYAQQEFLLDNTCVILPTAPGAAPLLDTPAEAMNEYRNQLMGLTAIAGLSKSVQVSLPYLQSDSCAWGLSVMTKQGGDKDLLALIKHLEASSLISAFK